MKIKQFPTNSPSSSSTNFVPLKSVINSDCCIGCGLCGYIAPDSVSMRLDSTGRIQALITDSETESRVVMRLLLEICPFTDSGPHENELSRELYSNDCTHHPEVGYYRSIFAGHVIGENMRQKTSSGGLITWLATRMLQQGMVDAVVHVTEAVDQTTDPLLFEYSISRTENEVIDGAKSKYYPIELSKVLKIIKDSPGRYLLIGLPCFIKGIRRLALNDPIIAERIVFTIGLVCGHLKSSFFAELLASQLSIPPSDLKKFDFRVKLPDRNAGGYGVRAASETSSAVTPSAALFGSDWGLHMFRYGACDFCDDVFAETADVVIGDAWLPEYIPDWKGNSLVIVRNKIIADLLCDSAGTGELKLDRIDPDAAVRSQLGGLRDRREDLQWRLELRRQQGQWAPAKRDFGKPLPPVPRRMLIETRAKLRKASLEQWARPEIRGNPEKFKALLRPILKQYRKQTTTRIKRFRSFVRDLLVIIWPRR